MTPTSPPSITGPRDVAVDPLTTSAIGVSPRACYCLLPLGCPSSSSTPHLPDASRVASAGGSRARQPRLARRELSSGTARSAQPSQSSRVAAVLPRCVGKKACGGPAASQVAPART